jgi:hypothetical protein
MPMMDRVTSLPMMPAVTGFLRWWGQELVDIFHALNPRKRPTARTVCILIEPDCVAVERCQGDEAERFVETCPFDSFDAAEFADLGALIEDARPRLLLQAPDIFTTSLVLPLAARSRIDAAVALQIGEIAPLRPEHLIWTIIDREIRDDQIRIRLAMAKKERIETIIDRFAAHDLPTPLICAADDGEGTPFPQVGASGWGGIDFGRHGLLLITALLVVSIPLTTFTGSAILNVRAAWRAEALEQPVREIRSAEHLAKRMEERRRLLEPLYRQPPVAAILNELAKKLPPDDWIRSIERKPDGRLALTVVAGDEAALDTALRSSRLLPGMRVSDRTPNDDKTVDLAYVTDAP